jgi:hypothetical protein
MSFLKNILGNAVIEEVSAKKSNSGGPRKQRNPIGTFLGIRIWKDGSIYPSQSLMEMFGLEYPKTKVTATEVPIKLKEGEVLAADAKTTMTKRTYEYPNGTGNGFDFVDSRLWGQFKGTEEQKFLAVAVTPKDSPRVDLFGSTKYELDGTPVSSVMDQGSATFGKDVMLEAIKEVYGVEPNEEGFIDLAVDISENVKALVPNGIFMFPKKIVRGEHIGKPDYIRRENVDMFALVPSTLMPVAESTTNGDAHVTADNEPAVDLSHLPENAVAKDEIVA